MHWKTLLLISLEHSQHREGATPPSNMHKLHAIIIGGSLGGLFAAHLLRLAGIEVQVFERAGDDLASRGAGIGTHPEMFEVLRRIGVPVDVN